VREPRAGSGEVAIARAAGDLVYAVIVDEGPQQVKMAMQSVAEYTSQISKLQDRAIGKRRIRQVAVAAGTDVCRRLQTRRFGFSERRRRKQGSGRREWSQGLCGVYGCVSATPIVIGVEWALDVARTKPVGACGSFHPPSSHTHTYTRPDQPQARCRKMRGGSSKGGRGRRRRGIQPELVGWAGGVV
jgi:hypothetical protein